MSDIIDQANDTAEFFLQVGLRNAMNEAPKKRALCEFCEEHPVEILPNGLHSRYCGDACASVAMSPVAA